MKKARKWKKRKGLKNCLENSQAVGKGLGRPVLQGLPKQMPKNVGSAKKVVPMCRGTHFTKSSELSWISCINFNSILSFDDVLHYFESREILYVETCLCRQTILNGESKIILKILLKFSTFILIHIKVFLLPFKKKLYHFWLWNCDILCYYHEWRCSILG